MEAVKFPMLHFDPKVSTPVSTFKDDILLLINQLTHEDAHTYTKACREMEDLRTAACDAPMDYTGVNTLKRYYAQLCFLVNRMPQLNGTNMPKTVFSWENNYTGNVVEHKDINFERANTLHTIACIHSFLGGQDNRSTPEGVKTSCTHFQSAAGAFRHVHETYSSGFSSDLSAEILLFQETLMLAQAQECILEKSMSDGRKANIIARIASQCSDLYNTALLYLNKSQAASAFSSSDVKKWKKLIELKVAVHKAVKFHYLCLQSEESGQFSERLAYSKGSLAQLETVLKLATGMSEDIKTCVQLLNDIVSGKFSVAKRENDFIYNAKIVAVDSLPEVKGALLAQGLPVNIQDKEISGPDIFAKLIPIEAHETSSIYSEKKAALLREVGQVVDSADNDLETFVQSLELKLDDINSSSDLPESLVEKCASISLQSDRLAELENAVKELSDMSAATSDDIKKILALLQQYRSEIEGSENSAQVSAAIPEIEAELVKCSQAFDKANTSNSNLSVHVRNIRQLSSGLNVIRAGLPPAINLLENSEKVVLDRIRHLFSKLKEMQVQRNSLIEKFRDALMRDDVTKGVINQGDTEKYFLEEIKKHDSTRGLIDANLAAQPRILEAITKCNVQFVPIRFKIQAEQQRQKESIDELEYSFQVFHSLIDKHKKGIEFYKKLRHNLATLHGKAMDELDALKQNIAAIHQAKAVKAAQEKALERAAIPAVPNRPEINSPSNPASFDGRPKLKDFLPSMKNRGQKPAASPSPNATFDQMELGDELDDIELPEISAPKLRDFLRFRNPIPSSANVAQPRATFTSSAPQQPPSPAGFSATGLPSAALKYLPKGSMPPAMLPRQIDQMGLNRPTMPCTMQPRGAPAPQNINFRPDSNMSFNHLSSGYNAPPIPPRSHMASQPGHMQSYMPPPTSDVSSPSVVPQAGSMQSNMPLNFPQASAALGPHFVSQAGPMHPMISFPVSQSLPPGSQPSFSQPNSTQPSIMSEPQVMVSKTVPSNMLPNVPPSSGATGPQSVSWTAPVQPPLHPNIHTGTVATSLHYVTPHAGTNHARIPPYIQQSTGAPASTNLTTYTSHQIQAPIPPQSGDPFLGQANISNHNFVSGVPPIFQQSLNPSGSNATAGPPIPSQLPTSFAPVVSSCIPPASHSNPSMPHMATNVSPFGVPMFQSSNNATPSVGANPAQMFNQRPSHPPSQMAHNLSNFQGHQPTNLTGMSFPQGATQPNAGLPQNQASFSSVRHPNAGVSMQPRPASIVPTSLNSVVDQGQSNQGHVNPNMSQSIVSQPNFNMGLFKGSPFHSANSVGNVQPVGIQSGAPQPTQPISSSSVLTPSTSYASGPAASYSPRFAAMPITSNPSQLVNHSTPNAVSSIPHNQAKHPTPIEHNLPHRGPGAPASANPMQPNVPDPSYQKVPGISTPLNTQTLARPPLYIPNNQLAAADSVLRMGNEAIRDPAKIHPALTPQLPIAHTPNVNTPVQILSSTSADIPTSASSTIVTSAVTSPIPPTITPTPTSINWDQPKRSEVIDKSTVPSPTAINWNAVKQPVSSSASSTGNPAMIGQTAASTTKSITGSDSSNSSTKPVMAVSGMPHHSGLASQANNSWSAASQPSSLYSKDSGHSRKSSLDSSIIPMQEPYSDQATLDNFTVSVEKYQKDIMSMTKPSLNGPSPLDKQWQELHEEQEREAMRNSMAAGLSESNRNRSNDALPYDKYRVVLSGQKNDYINASLIENSDPTSPRFIATQGPLNQTETDFWTMVIQQKVEILVTLSQTQDQGTEETVRYWPNNRSDKLNYGNLVITLVMFNNHKYWIERRIAVTNAHTKEAHHIVQLHFHTWSTNQLPECAPILMLVSEVAAVYRKSKGRPQRGTVLIHCRDGVTKTGIFLTLYQAVEYVNTGKGIPDVKSVLTNLRQRRKNMVSNKDGYLYCHTTLLYFLQDILVKKGILITHATFGNPLPSPGKSASTDFIMSDTSLALFGGLLSRQNSRVAPSGEKPANASPTTVSSTAKSSTKNKKSSPPNIQTTSAHAVEKKVSGPTIQSDQEKDGSSGLPTKSAEVPIFRGGSADTSQTNPGKTNTSVPPTPPNNGSSSAMKVNDVVDPSKFELGQGRQRISKADFLNPRAALTDRPKMENDPLSNLDVLWTHK